MVFEKFAFKNNLKNTSLEPFSNRTLDYFLCRGISEYRVEHPKFVILKDAFHLETKRRNTWKTKITSRLSKMKVIMLELLKALKVFDIYIYIYIYIYLFWMAFKLIRGNCCLTEILVDHSVLVAL